jgi:hypothetical protein
MENIATAEILSFFPSCLLYANWGENGENDTRIYLI